MARCRIAFERSRSLYLVHTTRRAILSLRVYDIEKSSRPCFDPLDLEFEYCVFSRRYNFTCPVESTRYSERARPGATTATFSLIHCSIYPTRPSTLNTCSGGTYCTANTTQNMVNLSCVSRSEIPNGIQILADTSKFEQCTYHG